MGDGRSIRVGISLLLALAVSACAGSQPASLGISIGLASSAAPAGSPSLPASAGPSTEPTRTPRPAVASARPTAPNRAPIAIDSIARVVTDGLRVRSKPEVGEASKLLTPLLDAGREVFVVAGPVRASGYSWYQVQPLAKVAEFEGLPFGWVAATGKDGEPWLASVPLTCPALPEDYAAFVALRPLVALSCFGDDDLTFAARLASPEATCGVEIDWTVEPDWLGSTCPHPTFLLADADRDDSTRDAILDPTMDVADLPQPGVEPADWIDILVTGHFDHMAARSCQGVSQVSVVPIDPAAVVLGCRTQFVLTYIEPSGYLPGPDA